MPTSTNAGQDTANDLIFVGLGAARITGVGYTCKRLPARAATRLEQAARSGKGDARGRYDGRRDAHNPGRPRRASS